MHIYDMQIFLSPNTNLDQYQGRLNQMDYGLGFFVMYHTIQTVL